MHRRALLSTLGLTAAGLAGCVSDGPAGPGSGPPEESPVDATPTESTPTDETPTPTVTASGPAPASDAFGDLECPSFDDHADRTGCYHDAAVDEASLVLAAEPEVVDPAADDGAAFVRFVLYNESGATIQFNPYDWDVHRRGEEGEWTHVAPEVHPEPMTSVATGERFTWLLPTGPAAGESAPVGDDRENVQPVGVELGAGTYAFSVTVSYVPADRETGDGETATRIGDATATEAVDRDVRTELVTLFELESDAEAIPSTPRS